MGLFAAADYKSVREYFKNMPPTPTVRLSKLAAALGVRELFVKDESSRFGLNAFKILGVSYAIDRLVRKQGAGRIATIVTSSTGNHGRAVAREGLRHGISVKVYVPRQTLQSNIDAIAREGAEVVVVDGNYDLTADLAASDARRFGWQLVSAPARPTHEEVPYATMAGYTWIMDEAARQWAPSLPPDVVIVQSGVGALACAVLSWLAYNLGTARPYTIVCEPSGAACLLESARAGTPVTLGGELATIMSGLRAGRVSSLAWPTIQATADAFLAIDDSLALSTADLLGRPENGDSPINSSPTAACGLAALRAIISEPSFKSVRDAAGLASDKSRVVLVINTEGMDAD